MSMTGSWRELSVSEILPYSEFSAATPKFSSMAHSASFPSLSTNALSLWCSTSKRTHSYPFFTFFWPQRPSKSIDLHFSGSRFHPTTRCAQSQSPVTLRRLYTMRYQPNFRKRLWTVACFTGNKQSVAKFAIWNSMNPSMRGWWPVLSWKPWR